MNSFSISLINLLYTESLKTYRCQHYLDENVKWKYWYLEQKENITFVLEKQLLEIYINVGFNIKLILSKF